MSLSQGLRQDFSLNLFVVPRFFLVVELVIECMQLD